MIKRWLLWVMLLYQCYLVLTVIVFDRAGFLLGSRSFGGARFLQALPLMVTIVAAAVILTYWHAYVVKPTLSLKAKVFLWLPVVVNALAFGWFLISPMNSLTHSLLYVLFAGTSAAMLWLFVTLKATSSTS